MEVVSKSTTALIDSGATHNFVAKRFVRSVRLHTHLTESLSVTLADGSKLVIQHTCYLPVKVAPGLSHVVKCHVMPSMPQNLILGMQWLSTVQPLIDWSTKEVTFNQGKSVTVTVGVGEQENEVLQDVTKVEVCSAKVGLKEVRKGAESFVIVIRPCKQDEASM